MEKEHGLPRWRGSVRPEHADDPVNTGKSLPGSRRRVDWKPAVVAARPADDSDPHSQVVNGRRVRSVFR